MPTPTVTPVSDTELRLSWPVPTEREARGVVTAYMVYHWQANDLTATPFAPPYSWLVGGAHFIQLSHKGIFFQKVCMIGECIQLVCIVGCSRLKVVFL